MLHFFCDIRLCGITNKAPAIEYGRNIAKNQHTEFFTHGKNGKIQSRDSYGNDPFPPKG